MTDASGNVVGEQRYYPFGETRWSTGSMFTDKLFTGQREMAGLGIYHYGARFYSPKLGRFLSADSIVPGYANPQSFNRYSYVLNNPLRYIDPSGFRPTGPCGAYGEECGKKKPKPPAYPPLGKTEDGTPKGASRAKKWIPPVDPMIRGGGFDYGDGHPGVDLNPDSNTNPNPPIVASSYGIVYSSTACTIDPCVGDSIYTSDGYGNVVIIGYDYDYLPQPIQALIPNGATLFVLYAHLESPSDLQERDVVEPGQLIGNVGNTGASNGTHLHMEIRIEGDDPLPVGDLHIPEGPEAGYTNVHRTWHNLLIPQNPHDFFYIP